MLSWLMTRLVGPARAKEFYFLADPIEANQALALGLVNRVVPAASLPIRDVEGATLFIQPERTATVATVRRMYPDAKVIEHSAATDDRFSTRTVRSRHRPVTIDEQAQNFALCYPPPWLAVVH